MPSVLKSFFSVRADQINKHALLPQVRCLAASCYVTVLLQALQHVSNLEEEGLLSEAFEAKSICFVVDIDLRVIGLRNPRGCDDFKSRN